MNPREADAAVSVAEQAVDDLEYEYYDLESDPDASGQEIAELFRQLEQAKAHADRAHADAERAWEEWEKANSVAESS